MALPSYGEGAPFKYSGVSLWTKLTRAVEAYPQNVALVCTHQSKGHLDLPNADLDDDDFLSNPYLRVTYASLAGAINKFANALLQRGVKPGTPIFNFTSNSIEYAIAVWTTYKLGCTWVPINPRNLLNKQETIHMIATALSCQDSQEAVIMANDQSIAEGLDALGIQCQLTKIIITDERRDGWLNFRDVLLSAPETMPQNPSFQTQMDVNDRLVMFTSGTTSLPKGVYMPTYKYALTVEQRDIYFEILPEDVLCVSAPNNHAIGAIWLYVAHTKGATLVFPGQAFNPQVMMDAMLRERVTRTSLVPTMVHALLGVKATKGGKISSLKSVVLGGSMVSPEIVNICLNELGAEEVDNIWGMTEGCVTTCQARPIHELMDGDVVSIGFPTPGSRVKVCAPDSKVPVPRGEYGELHFSGPMLSEGYIGKKSDDYYIGDDGEKWFITGDQATMDEQERIFITGRYKEMIIRGAENIAPAAIESTLMTVPDLMALNVQIVGAKDPIAGEVPVAVYMGKQNLEMGQKIQQVVLSKIGPAHVPDQAISLDQLNLKDYPRTMAGKIQKNKLAALVQDFRNKEDESTRKSSQSENELAQIVVSIWTRALGYQVSENEPIANFADSITVMKVRDTILKRTGKSLTLNDMVDANTIAAQIRMLQQQSQGAQPRKIKREPRTSPLTADDVVVFQSQPEAFESSKAAIEVELAKIGLSWNDVAEIIPAYDFGAVMNQTGVMDSWTFTMAYSTPSTTFKSVRVALHKTLRNLPVFTSLLMWDKSAFQSDEALHIVMHQTDRYLDSRIHDYGTIKTVKEVKELAELHNYPNNNAAIVPGPLFDANLIFIEEIQTVAVLMKIHHAVMDASTSLIFYDDLDLALGGHPLPERTDYKTWSDSYYALKTSANARIATKWHVDRLKGISSHRKALFFDKDTPRARDTPILATFDAPSFLTLRKSHPNITAPVILKTAFALFWTYKTNYPHAWFNNLQASRDRFPFVPKALEDFGYDYTAADVVGPTIETVVNLIEVRPHETVLDFFRRMQNDQDSLTKYAAAPLREIISGLGEEGELIAETQRTINYNWVPGMSRNDKTWENIKSIAINVLPDVRFNMNCGMGGEKGDTIMMHLMGTTMTAEQHWEAAKQLEKITLWLTDEKNWNMEVGGYKHCLDESRTNGHVSSHGSSSFKGQPHIHIAEYVSDAIHGRR